MEVENDREIEERWMWRIMEIDSGAVAVENDRKIEDRWR